MEVGSLTRVSHSPEHMGPGPQGGR
jgi:hypothetical protein